MIPRGKIFNTIPLTADQLAAKDLLFEFWRVNQMDSFEQIKTFRAKHPGVAFGKVFELMLDDIRKKRR